MTKSPNDSLLANDWNDEWLLGRIKKANYRKRNNLNAKWSIMVEWLEQRMTNWANYRMTEFEMVEWIKDQSIMVEWL